MEETIALIGTPDCVVAEGLADLGLEIIVPSGQHQVAASHLRPLGISYDADTAQSVGEAFDLLANAVRANVALLLHEDGVDPDDAVAYLERWSLLPRARATQAVRFQTDPRWGSYIYCYTEGVRLCRQFAGGDPVRFERLLTEQLLPADLVPA